MMNEDTDGTIKSTKAAVAIVIASAEAVQKAIIVKQKTTSNNKPKTVPAYF